MPSYPCHKRQLGKHLAIFPQALLQCAVRRDATGKIRQARMVSGNAVGQKPAGQPELCHCPAGARAGVCMLRGITGAVQKAVGILQILL